MKDCNKVWLILYVNVDLINRTDVPYFLSEIHKYFNYDETVNTIIVPINNENTHISLLNGNEIDENNKIKIEEMYDALNKAINSFKNDK